MIRCGWLGCRQNDHSADQPYKPTRMSVHHLHQQAVAMTNSGQTHAADLRVTDHLCGHGIHKNIYVSNTKVMLGLRVGFISSHSTADKLFLVNLRAFMGPPKMSLLHEAKSMPALIIKPTLILVAHPDDLGWNKTYNQQ